MRAHNLIYSLILLLGALFVVLPSEGYAQPLLERKTIDYSGSPSLELVMQSPPFVFIHNKNSHSTLPKRILTSVDELMKNRQYEEALNYVDSLIAATKHYNITGVRVANLYETRAHLLHATGEKRKACLAYEHALDMQESLMRLEQTSAIKGIQISYQLDRIALDQALLKAQHHRVTLCSVAMLFLAIIAVSISFYRTNRQLKRLHSELLLQIAHAKQSEAKKIDFINAMCHEVRTPLNCVSGFSELMCYNDAGNEAHAQYSEIIRDNCRQLRYLFDDLLEVSYLESLDQTLPHRYTDICTLCNTQLRVMKVRYPKVNVVYESAIPAEKIALLSNEKYLTLLLTALLSNAYKFTERGTIRLECNRDGEEFVRIIISDTGPGIHIKEHEHVFDRFTKLDTFSQGNGLGLYMCKLIVYHLGGTISIDSTYTAGTRIVVILPRRPKNSAATPTA